MDRSAGRFDLILMAVFLSLSCADWLQPFEASSMNSGNDPGWLLDEEASRMTTAATGAEPPRRGRHATGGDDAATLLVKAFSIDDGEDAAAVDIADIVKFDAAEHGMATDSPDDLEQFFKQGGSEGLDTFLADGTRSCSSACRRVGAFSGLADPISSFAWQ